MFLQGNKEKYGKLFVHPKKEWYVGVAQIVQFLLLALAAPAQDKEVAACGWAPLKVLLGDAQ